MEYPFEGSRSETRLAAVADDGVGFPAASLPVRADAHIIAVERGLHERLKW